jgi:hypothetical protein
VLASVLLLLLPLLCIPVLKQLAAVACLFRPCTCQVSRELEKECVVVFDEAHNIDNVSSCCEPKDHHHHHLLHWLDCMTLGYSLGVELQGSTISRLAWHMTCVCYTSISLVAGLSPDDCMHSCGHLTGQKRRQDASTMHQCFLERVSALQRL